MIIIITVIVMIIKSLFILGHFKISIKRKAKNL